MQRAGSINPDGDSPCIRDEEITLIGSRPLETILPRSITLYSSIYLHGKIFDMGVDVMLRFAVVVAKNHFHETTCSCSPLKYVAENFSNLFCSIFHRNTSSIVRIGIHSQSMNKCAFASFNPLNRFVLFAYLSKFA